MTTGMAPTAEPYEWCDGAWCVLWDAGLAHGSIGDSMTEAQAIELANKVKRGEVKP